MCGILRRSLISPADIEDVQRVVVWAREGIRCVFMLPTFIILTQRLLRISLSHTPVSLRYPRLLSTSRYPPPPVHFALSTTSGRHRIIHHVLLRFIRNPLHHLTS